MKKPALLVLAAGLGSRYNGQKQIDGLGKGNEILMEFALSDAIKRGLKKAVFIVNDQFPEEMEDYLRTRLEKKGCKAHFVAQTKDKFIPEQYKSKIEGRKKPLGTAHAVYCAKDYIEEPFITINADDFYGPDTINKAFDLVENGDLKDDQYGMVSFQLRNTLSKNGTVSRGVCTVEGGLLKGVEEHTSIEEVEGEMKGVNEDTNEAVVLDDKTPVSMNFWVLSPSFFDYAKRDLEEFLANNEDLSKKEFYLPSVVDKAVQQGEVKVKVEGTHEKWFGLTYHDDKALAVEEVNGLKEKGVYPENLWN